MACMRIDISCDLRLHVDGSLQSLYRFKRGTRKRAVQQTAIPKIIIKTNLKIKTHLKIFILIIDTCKVVKVTSHLPILFKTFYFLITKFSVVRILLFNCCVYVSINVILIVNKLIYFYEKIQ